MELGLQRLADQHPAVDLAWVREAKRLLIATPARLWSLAVGLIRPMTEAL